MSIVRLDQGFHIGDVNPTQKPLGGPSAAGLAFLRLMMIKVRSILPLLVLVLLGCDRLGIEDPAKAAGLREADGKAAGAACRHAGRSLEDCFERYPQAQKAAVFSGWREMNDYMIQNKMESVPPAAGTSPNNSALSMDPKATDKEVAGEKQAVDATADEKRRTEKPEKPRRAGGA